MKLFNKIFNRKLLPVILVMISAFSLHAQISLTIDGVGDDAAWATAPAFQLNKIIAQESASGITGTDDISGMFKILWDANNIYYYLEVKDDILYTTNGTSYLNDNFGIYFDLKNIKCEFYGSDNSDTTIFNWEYQWQNDVWGGRTATGSGGEWGGKWSGLYAPDSGTQYVTVVNDGVGYSIEFMVPVTDKAGITLEAGDTIGFDTKIADNDGDGRDQIGWNMSEDMAWHKPTFFGSLKLLADGTVEPITYTPSITGVGDYTWTKAPYFSIDKKIALESKTGIKNDNDLSGKFKLLWDANNLYYLLEVKDDTLFTSSGTSYLNDNFGIYFDLKNIKCDFYGSDNSDSTIFNWEYQWQNDVWGGRTATGSGGEWGGVWSGLYTPDSGLHYVPVVGSGGYSITFKIPVTEKAGITLAAGDTIGFDTKIADNDGTGRDQKGWNMSEDMAWHKPTFFGSLRLLADGTVEKIDITPEIDGVAEYAWNQAAFIPIAKTIALESKTGIKNDNDLSGKYKLLWDANNIYYYLEVKDDTLFTTSGTSYLNDNFGIYFDLKNIKCEFYGSDNSDSTIFNWEYQWENDVWGGRTATGAGGEWGGVWSALYTPDSGTYYVPKVTAGTGYSIEWKIPITEKAGISLKPGTKIGFDTKVADNDGTGRDQLGWYMSSDIAWHKPMYFGTLTAVKGGTFQFSTPLSNVADLKSLSVSEGTLDPAFDPNTLSYKVELPIGTTVVPEITATAKSSAAKVAISALDVLPGKDTITVTAEDKITSKQYIINFMISTSVSDNTVSGLVIYPNPAENVLTVTCAEPISSINLYDISGRMVTSFSVNAPHVQLNLASLNSGVYFIKVQTEKGSTMNRIIKK
jgi:hypothetical protein